MAVRKKQSSPRGHTARVVPHDTYKGERVYRFKCTCGALSWDFDTEQQCREQADIHEVRAAQYDARETTDNG